MHFAANSFLLFVVDALARSRRAFVTFLFYISSKKATTSDVSDYDLAVKSLVASSMVSTKASFTFGME